ncbi:hypothetical protein GNX18_12655 [Microbulbifer sp. SH-1]|uniref:hypothetical protein n=1 Tax=Microbulbifer sp. SH-1 TaxID=2681547 RepID=UPI00140E6E21|nr:hypothetical protein [Microbulbifer sp. SH-1]QIL90512.1 hypothetical protein GNX18_12655 [Microbulbifer sp. SH-1]
MKWQPITEAELEKVIELQCSDLDQGDLEYFESIRVPLTYIKIERWGNSELVFMVAKSGSSVVYYEDIEEGFEISGLNEEGVVIGSSKNQFTLEHVVNQLRATDS